MSQPEACVLEAAVGQAVTAGSRVVQAHSSFTRCSGDLELFHVQVGDCVFVSDKIGCVSAILDVDGMGIAEVMLFARPRDCTQGHAAYHGAAEVLLTQDVVYVPLTAIMGKCRVLSYAAFVQQQVAEEATFYCSMAECVATDERMPSQVRQLLEDAELHAGKTGGQAANLLQRFAALAMLAAGEEYAEVAMDAVPATTLTPQLLARANVKRTLCHLLFPDAFPQLSLPGLPAIALLACEEALSSATSPPAGGQGQAGVGVEEAKTVDKEEDSAEKEDEAGSDAEPTPIRRITRSSRVKSRLVIEDDEDGEDEAGAGDDQAGDDDESYIDPSDDVADEEEEGSEGDADEPSRSPRVTKPAATPSPSRRSQRIPKVRKARQTSIHKQLEELEHERETTLGSPMPTSPPSVYEQLVSPGSQGKLAVSVTPGQKQRTSPLESPKKVQKLSDMTWMEQVEHGMPPAGAPVSAVTPLRVRQKRISSSAEDLVRQLKARQSPVKVKSRSQPMAKREEAEGNDVDDDDSWLEMSKEETPKVQRTRLRKKRRSQLPQLQVQDQADVFAHRPHSGAVLAVEQTEEFESDASLDGFIVDDEEEVLSGMGSSSDTPYVRKAAKKAGGKRQTGRKRRSPFAEPDDTFEVRQVFTLRQAMTVYVQYLASALLDRSFAEEIRDTRDEPYFSPACDKVEHAIRYRKNALLSSQAWHFGFRRDLLRRPSYRSWPRAAGPTDCQACGRANHTATFEVALEGVIYDSEQLWANEILPLELVDLVAADVARKAQMEELPESPVYRMGKHCKTRTKLWHQLHHFKYAIIMKVRDKLGTMRTTDAAAAVQQLLGDERWIEKLYSRLLCLINDADSYGTTDG